MALQEATKIAPLHNLGNSRSRLALLLCEAGDSGRTQRRARNQQVRKQRRGPLCRRRSPSDWAPSTHPTSAPNSLRLPSSMAGCNVNEFSDPLKSCQHIVDLHFYAVSICQNHLESHQSPKVDHSAMSLSPSIATSRCHFQVGDCCGVQPSRGDLSRRATQVERCSVLLASAACALREDTLRDRCSN